MTNTIFSSTIKRRLFKIVLKNGRYFIYFFEGLVFLNIWINGYIVLLKFLNSRWPVLTSPSPDLFINKYLRPEPYEIPLFIIVLIISVFIIFGYNLKKEKLRAILIPFFLKHQYLFFGLFLSLLITFIYRLGSYPLSEGKHINFYYLNYYFLFMFFCLYVTTSLNMIIDRKKSRFLTYLFIFFGIALITYEPGFPIGPNDYSTFLGPIYEIAHGKTIYSEIPSQYGFFSVITLGFLAKTGWDVIYLPVLVWLFYILEYFLCFYLVYKTSNSLLLALLGLFSVITVNYFSLIHLPIQLPQVNAFRWPSFILALFLLSYFKSIWSKAFIFLIALLCFWTVDAGIAILTGYIFTNFLFLLKKISNWKNILVSFIYLTFSILIIFSLIQLIHTWLGYETIDYQLIFEKFKEHSLLGFNMVPIPGRTFFWTVVIIYVFSLAYFFSDKTNKVDVQLLLFSANSSIFASLYYLSRSVENNLFNISIFPILNVFLLLSLLLPRIRPKNLKIFFVLIFVVFVLIPTELRNSSISHKVQKRIEGFKINNFFQPEIKDVLNQDYNQEKALIEQIRDESIIILSPDDTYYFYLSGRKNLLNANPQYMLYSKKEIVRALTSVKKCPKQILVSCKTFVDKCQEDLISYHWQDDVQSALLKELTNICGNKYTKVRCTSKLCLAELK
ncbi:MAG: hypothetical protein V1858_00095 [Candidatus Gottesmanbacteria bacterium]